MHGSSPGDHGDLGDPGGITGVTAVTAVTAAPITVPADDTRSADRYRKLRAAHKSLTAAWYSNVVFMALARKDDLINEWGIICRTVDYAFQPVVSTFTGQTIAFEALLRGCGDAGFTSIQHLLDAAVDDGVVVEVNGMLLARAAERFRTISGRLVGRRRSEERSPIRLFFNVDNRVFLQPHAARHVLETMESSHLPADCLTLEISERIELPAAAHDDGQVPLLRRHGVQIALDDFGSGYSGLQMLYQADSDLIKIDRFFIAGVDRDATKRIFVTNLVGMAHAMGLHVTAEGVETSAEYYACREIGCDSIQGYLVAHPQREAAELQMYYPVVERLVRADRRRTATAGRVLKQRIRSIPPIMQGTPILDVLRRFRDERETTFLPVVTARNEPVGILREHDLKEYVYSPFGISLLMNRTYGEEPYSYVRRVPIVPADSRIDRVLELAAQGDVAEALIVTENGRYLGCLDARALLQILHERELAFARDQNPLTRLPGNALIAERFAALLPPTDQWAVVTYFDFDTFKPFNDTYGFRVGDRVIQLFADLLRTGGVTARDFCGHVGGDDFISIAVRSPAEVAEVEDAVHTLLERFAQDVKAFYRREDVEAGGITARDRTGVLRWFPLLSAGAAMLFVPPHTTGLAAHRVTGLISRLKQTAKMHTGSVVAATVRADVAVDTKGDIDTDIDADIDVAWEADTSATDGR